ncbi:hypothetical protein CANINC_001558 [Pichia inconspicua]|uniref:TUG ubiquitin-like domain-containing protein n=1 Tax=Pichia inconspicua TaxID=52247 RepID=A0A4T0X3R3_9ASCO|nr:hypothetical protein CANINC_001558 [[Candida] inconspicua]
MPSIKIIWNLSIYNTSVNPTTLISDIITDSIRYFKLSGKTESYALKINGKDKPIDRSLSIRFLNLPQGAHLELIYQGEEGNGIEKVKIRSTIINSINNNTINNLIDEYEPNLKVNDLISSIAGLNVENIIYNGLILKIQTITKVFEITKIDNNLTLADLGLSTGNHAIRIMIGKVEETDDDGNNKSNNNNKLVNWGKKVLDMKKKEEEKEKGRSLQAENVVGHNHVELPKEEEADVDVDDDDNLLTISQARKYQEMLSRRAAEEPMLTRSLREKMALEEAASKEQKLREIRNMTPDVEIKIVLPNSKAVVVKIDKCHVLDELVNVLNNRILSNEAKRACSAYLKERGETFFYTLCTGHPDRTVVLGNKMDMDHSWRKCKLGEEPLASLLGNRVTLYLTVDPAYRGVIGDIAVASTSATSATTNTTTNTTHTSTHTHTSKNKKTLSKLPKWARLGKK